MGPDPSPLVVDFKGHVHGTERLLVADASIMPEIPSANTNLPTIMIAERIAAAVETSCNCLSAIVPAQLSQLCRSREVSGPDKQGLAEGEGFEPPIRLPVYTLSRRAPSTTRPSLRCVCIGVVRNIFQVTSSSSVSSSPRLRHQRYRLCRWNSAITRFEPPPASVIYAPPLQQRHRTF